MPLFSKRARRANVANDNVGNTGASGGNHHGGRNIARPPFRFGAWLRLHGFDLLTMAIFGALALGIYFANPAPNRNFPLFNVNGEVIYPQFAYPLRRQIIPIWAAALIAFFVPFIFFTLFQIRRRSADDWLTTIMGLLRSLITAALFQVMIKWLIGGLRPHFYSVCQPNINAQSQPSGVGFANLMYDRSICTGNKRQIDDALESMPSGHATAAWAGLLFLALYFNAQLKVLSAHNPAYWKMILFFAPILGAFLISASLTIDAYHNWYDIVIGALIGSACAFVAFRQTFAAIWDFRFNHVLLPRATSLFHRQAFLPSGREPYYTYQPNAQIFSHDLPFTREGGWGHLGGEQHTGAPGDATVLTSGLGGMGAGMGTGIGGMGTHGYGSPNTFASKAEQGDMTHTGNGLGSSTFTAGNHLTGGNNMAGANPVTGGNTLTGHNHLTGTGGHPGGTRAEPALSREPRQIS